MSAGKNLRLENEIAKFRATWYNGTQSVSASGRKIRGILMEVFKNYVDFLFKDLPQDERISVAKQELLRKIQKKYDEFVKIGKSESEAVSLAISEFKNLNSVAVDLGIADFLKPEKSEKKNNSNCDGGENKSNGETRKISTEVAQNFLNARKKTGLMRSLGIALFILCVCPPVFANFFCVNDSVGVFFMFLFIAAGVLLCVFSNSPLEDFSFLKTENCVLQEDAKKYLEEKRRENLKSYRIFISAGVIFFVATIFPMLAFDDKFIPIFFFVFVALGVFLIVYASIIQSGFKKLLNIETANFSNPSGENKKSKKIDSVYWQTVACVYLVFSFLTRRWDVSWLVWPVAAVGFTFLKNAFSNDD